jgi:serine phosphatase RsbU (regulator of sigma subunit)
LRYVNAGHEPALLFRKRRDRVAQLEHTGTVLGLTVRSNYGQRSIPIEPGDALVVFTAGLVETANIDGAMFGAKGIIDVVRRLSNGTAASIVSTALDEAARHAGWGLRSSDQGIAVVRLVSERELPAPLKQRVKEPARELALAAA